MTLSLFGSYKWCDKYGNWHSGYPSDLTKCYTLLKCDWWGNWYDCTPASCPKLDGTVEGTAGNDIIDLHYSGDPDGDRIDDSDAIVPGAGSQDDLVYGYGGNDNIQTFHGNDVAYGGTGDDTIDDASGSNQGAGNDTFFGDEGNDRIWGGIGNDKLYGGADNDSVDGEEGNDLVDGGAGHDTLYGGTGHDTVLGGTGNDVAYGGDGNDFIDDALGSDQGTGRDTFYGGAGDDTLWGGLDDDKLYGGTGNDHVGGEEGNDDIQGNEGDDNLSGGSGNDRIFGDNGGGAGATPVTFVRESFEWSKALDPSGNGTAIDDGDNLNGGFSQDTGNVTVRFSVAGATEHPVTTFETEQEKVHSITDDGTPVNAYSSLDSLLNLDGEKVTYKLDFSDDVKNVSFRINDIDNASKVQIKAYDLNGKLVPISVVSGLGIIASNTDGVAGNETLLSRGSDGLETNPDYSALVNVAGPIAWIEITHIKVQSVSPGNDAGINVTDIYFDAPVAGSGTAAGGNDHISGGLGQDIIAGEAGNDVLEGNGGQDYISGGAGNDTINAGTGDEADVSTGAASGARPAASYQNAYAGGAGNDIIHGGAGDDIITGDDDSRVSAATGETFNAGADGSDTLYGGAGNDEIHTGSWSDGEQGLTNISSGIASDTAYGGAGDDILRGAGGIDALYGDAGNDDIAGGAGADRVFGGDGRDTIGGGTGDVVDGGSGGDDYDVLVLDNGTFYINVGPGGTGIPVLDADGNSFTGRVVFTDVNGVATGEFIDYTEIEEIRGGTPFNGTPDALNDALSAGEDDAASVIGNVLVNDTDPNGDPLIVSAVNGSPANVGSPIAGGNGGSFTINPNGTVSFDPAGDFESLGVGETATTTVTYSVSDGKGGTDTATVTVTVTGANDAPIAVMDSSPASEDGVMPLANVLGNDTDPDTNDTLTVSAVNGSPANVGLPIAADNGGLVTINPDGTASFNANGEFNALGEGETATTKVSYTVTDGNGGTSTTTVAVIVTGTNDAPVATNNIYTVDAAEMAGDIDGNVITDNTGTGVDSDPEGDTLTVVGVGQPVGNVGSAVAGNNGGLFTINADGSVDFDANGDFDALGLNETATTSISYTISDGKGGTSTATTSFVVGGKNDGTVFGIDGNDVMNPGYVDDNGDIIDGNDAILPGDVGNDDLIYGLDGNDTINAGAGNDEVYGGTGNDVVTGGNGDDTVFGDEGNDVVRGGNGNDTVSGGDGDDSAFGGDGDDNVFGDAGNDTVNGNAGNDVLYGGVGDDVLAGQTGDDTLYGDAGNDLIQGDAGNDLAYGGEGVDVIDTSNHVDPGFDNPYPGLPGDLDPNNDRDTVFGGAGNDTITTGDDADSIDGGAGNDTIDAGIDDDVIDGGLGDDVIIGGEGVDIIAGGDGDDLIYGGLDNDTLDIVDVDGLGNPVDKLPGNNKDTIFGGAGNDTIYGRDDADSIAGGSGNDLIYGGIDDDTIAGNQGNDTIYGDQGNDTLTGSLDDDLVYGGTGDDFIQGGGGTDTLFGDAGNDRIQGGGDDDSIYGGSGDDSIQGGGGEDFIDGGGGNDLIGGFDGADSILGGEGDDVILSQGGDDSIKGGDGNDVIYGGAGNDKVEGNMGDDTIYGGDGDDSLTGSIGNDSVYGGAGNDFIQGGADTDLLDGGDGDDRIQGDGGDDSIRGGDGNDSIQGGGGNDVMDGGAGDDIIGGFTGEDTIIGGTGNDTIQSGSGSDVIYGGTGDDVILTDQSADAIPDRDYPGDGLAPDADPFDNRDTAYGGDGNDTIRTGDDADLIFGGAGTDDIDGGIDNDTISSGAGEDVVKGGLGSDRFTDASTGDVFIGGEDPDDSDIDTFNFDQATLDKIDRIERNGGAGDSEAMRESGTIYFKDGTTATFKEIEAPCFTPGTTIATPRGERLVEDLRAGDKIITRDNGIQEIAWIGSKEMTGKELAAKPHMKPILIKAGALGQGLPERDMVLSPNHRVLVASEKTQLYFEEREVLAAAKHMTGAQGIHTLDVMRTTYIHFMFERHEVVLSNGAWTESFHPGDYSLNGLGNSQRNEIFELFPELATAEGLEGYQSARKALKKHEARLLMK